MIYATDKKNCKNGLVQYMPKTDENQLILGKDGIILWKIGDVVAINKYRDHESRADSPFHEMERVDEQHFTELFKFNETYLNFSGSKDGFLMLKNHFFKSDDGALILEEVVPLEKESHTEIASILSRAEIESMFDANKYDAMFVLNNYGMVTFAGSKNDRLRVGRDIIPSDDAIRELDLKNRLWNYEIGRVLEGEQGKKPRTGKIGSIREMPLYGPSYKRNFSHLLLTMKDGSFDLMWFKIDFVWKDRFRLTASPVFFKEPTVDDVINYCKSSEVEPVFEPHTVNDGRKKKI